VNLFPLFLKLDGKRCVVAGAGAVALEKIESLLRCGARVVVVAPEAVSAVRRLSETERVEWVPRPFRPEDLDGAHLAIAATSDREVNRLLFEEASRRSILANAVDDPPLCDFFCASIVERGALQIAISTGGKSPALAQRLRRELDALLAPDLGRWLEDLGELRGEVLRAMPAGEERKMLLHELAGRELCAAPDCPARQDAKARAQAARERSGLTERREETSR
jgi:siroheme synthase-like protein